MRAIVQDRYGNADVLELRTIDRPSITSTEVLIEAHAAGIDRGVAHIMTGTPYLIRLAGTGSPRPSRSVLGVDVAGRVDDVGEDVTRFRPGDEVFGVATGALAAVRRRAGAQTRLTKPSTTSRSSRPRRVAIAGITALQALRDGAPPGRTEGLIVGASGGVGTFAVQIAKSFGAHVTGVCSTATRARALARRRPRHRLHAGGLRRRRRRYDLIIDIGDTQHDQSDSAAP